MDGISYREAEPADADAAFAVVSAGLATYGTFAPPGWQAPTALSVQEIRTRLERPGGFGVLAITKADDTVAGFAGFEAARGDGGGLSDQQPSTELAHVYAVFAAPDHWGTGIATALLQRLHDEARARGYVEGRLFTPVLQARARAFYAREGWREVSGPLDAPPLGLDVVELRRAL